MTNTMAISTSVKPVFAVDSSLGLPNMMLDWHVAALDVRWGYCRKAIKSIERQDAFDGRRDPIKKGGPHRRAFREAIQPKTNLLRHNW
jgi:hypothetical protein